jgi:hypothetical protein
MLHATASHLHSREFHMISKPPISVPSKSNKISHPEMMGDETEEQNLNEKGDPALRIESDEIEAAFRQEEVKKP